MKRIYVFILLAAASVLTLQAVDPRTELGTNPDRSASNHYAYPYPADKTLPQLTKRFTLTTMAVTAAAG